jgi:hypothetical protein
MSFVSLAATIDPHGHPVLGARSALDLVDSADRVSIISAWDRVREIGAAQIRVRLRGGEDATLYFFDLRERHEVLTCVLVADVELGTRTTLDGVEVTPRGSRLGSRML